MSNYQQPPYGYSAPQNPPMSNYQNQPSGGANYQNQPNYVNNAPAPPSGYGQQPQPNYGHQAQFGYGQQPQSGYPGSSGAPGFRPSNNLPPPSMSNVGINNPPIGIAATAPSSTLPTNKPNVQFFSTAGAVPVPTTVTAPFAGGMPPPSGAPGGGMPLPPPPSFGGGGPPIMGMGPPPTGATAGLMPPPPSGIVGAALGPSGNYMMGGASPATHNMVGMPTAFDSGNNLAGYGASGGIAGGSMMSNPNDPNNIPGGGGINNNASSGAPLPQIEEMDLSIQCNPAFMRATISKIVGNQVQANNAKIPLGLVCKPMAGDHGTENEEIEVVDFGATGIVRCKRCRTYINPFVTWADNGRRWRCNICGMLNDVPSTYFSHLDNNNQRRDKHQRPELSRCSVEFVAPGDYMVRPPQSPVYFFVIDVSEAAVNSGMIAVMANAIKASLDELPGGVRTQIGFITFDAHIHYYNLNRNLQAPQMLVVSDVSDPIQPLPEDLLVNLTDSRLVVDALLDALPSMFKPTAANSAGGGAFPGAAASNVSPQSCTGPALNAAKRVIQHIGGKLLLFQSSLPMIGEGALKMRENPRMLGSDKEHTMLCPEDPWYKTNAIDFSRLQIAVDTFLFAPTYTDLATISVLSKYSSGSTYYYPSFLASRDRAKFQHDLQHNLVRATAFEAVMRVRATRGVRFSSFYGNYFIRGTDLLALPNCHADSSFSLDMAYDEAQLSAQAITIQAALLYTSSAGERRIRVHTMVLPVTHNVAEMVDSLDIDCAMNLLAKQAVDIAQKTGMENARQRVNQTTIEIMRAARMGTQQQQQQPYGSMQQPSSQSTGSLPNSLLLLPLYSMSLQKSSVLRGGTDTRVDERAYFQQLLNNMDIEESKVFIYPRMFSIHDMTGDMGLRCDNADEDCPTAGPLQVRLPSILNLSYERLHSSGVFLMENGHDMFMWIGRQANPAVISTLFGLPSLENADMMSLCILPENSDFSSRVDAVITALRQDRARYMQLHFIREGDCNAEAYFARYLIEDRANFSGGGMSYTEYHSFVTRSISGLPG